MATTRGADGSGPGSGPEGTAGGGSAGTVTGSIVFGDPGTFPPDTTLTIQLLDVSAADAPSVTLAEQVVDRPGGPVVPFALPYDHAAIDPRHSYTVSARASRGDELLYISTTHNPVLTGGASERIDVPLTQVVPPPG
jgi:putative lipoprotein